MTTQHLILAFLAGALLATVATWGRVKMLLRSNACLRAKLAAADDTLSDLRKRLAIVNAANDALEMQKERSYKAFRSAKKTLVTANRSLGQYHRERRAQS